LSLAKWVSFGSNDKPFQKEEESEEQEQEQVLQQHSEQDCAQVY
jgi:hypothetical protein